MAKQLSFTEFKRECRRRGLNPAVATRIRQMRKLGEKLSAEEFAPLWREFCRKHTGWNRVVQLAGEKGYTI